MLTAQTVYIASTEISTNNWFVSIRSQNERLKSLLIQRRGRFSRLPCYVFCICPLTYKYQKYKSVELGDQLRAVETQTRAEAGLVPRVRGWYAHCSVADIPIAPPKLHIGSRPAKQCYYATTLCTISPLPHVALHCTISVHSIQIKRRIVRRLDSRLRGDFLLPDPPTFKLSAVWQL